MKSIIFANIGTCTDLQGNWVGLIECLVKEDSDLSKNNLYCHILLWREHCEVLES